MFRLKKRTIGKGPRRSIPHHVKGHGDDSVVSSTGGA
ncbi:hypothetical protein A2U01_0081916, partial [Trifolium medium]|nr:hypothetical protein [Trifolium medium]